MSKTRNNICNFIIIILSIIFFTLVIVLCKEVFNRSHYTTDANSFYYDINDGRYAEMVISAEENRAMGVRETKELKPCYAVADYFEAASYYKVYIENDKKEVADKYLKTMTACRKDMDDFEYAADDIDEKLGIVYR